MTIMFCSFEKQPLILRLYGKAKVIHPRDKKWGDLIQLFLSYISARQIFELKIKLVQTSCGFGVPYYELKGERPTIAKWSESRGKTGVENYWEEKNLQNVNEKETGIFNIPV